MSTLAAAVALALAFQAPPCTPMCAASTTTGSPHAAAAEKSESSLPCHEMDDAGPSEPSGAGGCGHDCEGCGLFARGFSGTAKPAVPAAPALLLLPIPVVQIDEPRQSRIDLRGPPYVRKRSLPILHSSLLL